MSGSTSRIAGPGALFRSLRTLLQRVDRYGTHRARTGDEVRWANILGDSLEHAFNVALTPSARAALAAVDRRRALSVKARSCDGRGAEMSIAGGAGQAHVRAHRISHSNALQPIQTWGRNDEA